MLLTDFSVPNVGIHHKEDNTQAYVDGNLTGSGSLYVAESEVTWLSSGGEGGFCLEYSRIILHAISRDTTAFPHQCVYLQVEGKLIEEEEDRESDSSEVGILDDCPTTEVRFVPADREALESIYSSLSACQKLHPDPDDEDSDNEQFGDELYNGEEGEEALTEQGAINLQRFENMLRQGQGDALPPQHTNGNQEQDVDHNEANGGGQFDDADNMQQ